MTLWVEPSPGFPYSQSASDLEPVASPRAFADVSCCVLATVCGGPPSGAKGVRLHLSPGSVLKIWLTFSIPQKPKA